jgi:hypothetical protein
LPINFGERQMIHSCDECGKKFDRRTTWQKFCSPLCRLRQNRRQKREQAAREAKA